MFAGTDAHVSDYIIKEMISIEAPFASSSWQQFHLHYGLANSIKSCLSEAYKVTNDIPIGQKDDIWES